MLKKVTCYSKIGTFLWKIRRWTTFLQLFAAELDWGFADLLEDRHCLVQAFLRLGILLKREHWSWNFIAHL